METVSSGTLQSSTVSDSSKTGSSKSHDSTTKAQDLSKDNTASPIDLECHIQAERITKILDESIYKIKLAVCLPSLVHEYQTLSSVLSAQHLEDLLYIFEQYEDPLFSSSFINVGAMEDIKAGDVSLKNRLNPELGHVIYLIGSYSALKPKVEEMVEEMKKDYTQKLIEESKQTEPETRRATSVEFLVKFEKFRDLMVEQMGMTAAEELATKIDTRRLMKSNEKLIEKIEEYKKQLKEESENFVINMKEKSDMIVKLEEELMYLHHDATMRLKKKILDSERQMVLASRAHVVKHEMLKEEQTEITEAYENLLRTHLADEKNQRQRRFKVETQLLSWIQKYDLEMGDKQIELDDFTDKYNEELKRCEELESDLALQDIEYIPLMAEREEEYHQEMTNKMTEFMLEHAARVIQNAWREVLANRAEKKRLRKLQKKMQAAAAAKGGAKK